MSLNGADVRARFSEVLNGIRGALDFMDTEFSLPSINNLPYQNCLVPLATFFAVPGGSEAGLNDSQRREISRWFWRTAYSKRYSSGVLRSLDNDISAMRKLRRGEPSSLARISVSIDEEFFLTNKFLINSVNTKTFIATLAQARPRNFVSGTAVDLRTKLQRHNRKEFHHLIPRSFLRESRQDEPHENVLANFCFIARADNRELGGEAPSVYRSKMAQNVEEILESHICPNVLFDDDFVSFTRLRARALQAKARELCDIEG